MTEPARRVARKEGRQALEPLRPGAEDAGCGAREVGHIRQGRRRDAGGGERRGGLHLGEMNPNLNLSHSRRQVDFCFA